MTPRNASETPALPVRWAGLVLAGGRATRFGGEKAAALMRGRPLMAWCAGALGGACEVVAVNVRRESEAERLATSLDFEILYDDPAHPAGPLAGVAAGLTWARARGFNGLVTLPCDTPLVGADELTQLIGALGEQPAVYAVAAGRAQGLCAVWRTSLAGPLGTRLTNGDHPAVHRWLAEIGATYVAFAHGAAFGNINTREDLATVDDVRASRARTADR